MAKKLYIIISLATVTVVGYLLFSSPSPAPVLPTGANVPAPGASALTTSTSLNPNPTTPPQLGQAVNIPSHLITHADRGFSPNSLSIKQGERVIFMNQGTKPMWPASAVHPTHNVYPEKGGCVGSKFDACQPIAPGQSWEFQFNFKGTWRFHNHLSHGETGVIIVQ